MKLIRVLGLTTFLLVPVLSNALVSDKPIVTPLAYASLKVFDDLPGKSFFLYVKSLRSSR